MREFADKKLGQNFLIDSNIVANLVSAAQLSPSDTILEVGPGEGVVTQELVKRAKNVIAVEIDIQLVEKLRQKFRESTHLNLVQADILDYIPTFSDSYKIVASLPYQITSPFLHRVIFGELGQVKSLTLIIQKEVAEKITAQPPQASYLYNLVAVWGEAQYLETIPAKSFNPAPKVESALITIVRGATPERLDSRRFSRFLHRGFSSPRKMLNKVFTPEGLEANGIDPKRRAETLTLEEWVQLFENQKNKT